MLWKQRKQLIWLLRKNVSIDFFSCWINDIFLYCYWFIFFISESYSNYSIWKRRSMAQSHISWPWSKLKRYEHYNFSRQLFHIYNFLHHLRCLWYTVMKTAKPIQKIGNLLHQEIFFIFYYLMVISLYNWSGYQQIK